MRSKKVVTRVGVGVLLALAMFFPTAVAQASSAISLDVPSSFTLDQSNALTLHLPANVAAIEGRVLVDSSVATLIGVAPVNKGTALSPADVDGGYAFGVYGMPGRAGQNDLRLVFQALSAGQIDVSVVIDAAANRAGRRISLATTQVHGTVHAGRGGNHFSSPTGRTHGGPARAASALRSLFGRNTVNQDDVDIARAAWYASRGDANSCQTGALPQGDANGDGCIDIVDLEALTVSQGGKATDSWGPTAAPSGAAGVQPASQSTSAVKMATTGSLTFTVNSTADTPDAANGDGICADSQGRCTFRAALDESNWDIGHNTIDFNIPGPVPALIQLASPMQLVGSSSSSVTIDGYSQPGSQVNTATYGTNAIPGVELRGISTSSSKYILYTARPNNVIRGLVFANAYRGIFIDTPNASGNLVVGNWIGFNGDGSLSALGHAGVYLNDGAHDNIIGTPALADRNVVGNQDKGLYSYGPGTDHNIMQNNLICTSPTGATAECATGIDFDFGPKNALVGGSNPGELNVIGRTTLNGIEISHGWDPSTNHVSTAQYQNNYNQIIGNWVGFREDGSYDPSYLSAQKVPSADNGQALHAYDGSNYNLFQANYVGAAYDGVTIAETNATGNIVRGNIIGRSPLGQAAPLQRYGIYFTNGTFGDTAEANIIDNVGAGGVEILDAASVNIRISQNLVFDTNGPAIYLRPDQTDPTKGANDLLAAPKITAATTVSISGTGINGATVEVFEASRNVGAYGLPSAYLGAATVDAQGNWSVAATTQAGERVTATQIATNNDTSSLAANVIVGSAPAPTPEFTWQQEQDKLAVDFTDASTGEPTSWSWDFGDGTTSTAENPTHTFTSAGDHVVQLTVANSAGSNTKSHTVTVQPVSTGTSLVTDTFSRDQNSGWGNADVGGLYAVEGVPANFSVSGGTGAMTVPGAGANRAASLPSVSGLDVDMRVRVTAATMPAGGALFIYAEGRRNGSNSYRGKLIVNPNGSVAVQASRVINGTETDLGPQVTVPGLTFTPNTFIWLAVDVTGVSPSTITVKAWADGSAEPANAQFSANDSVASLQSAGAVGLRAYSSRSVTNSPLTVLFDDYSVMSASAPPPGPIAADAFSRTVSGGWGSADAGGTYTLIGASSSFNVDGSAGTITAGSASTSRGAYLAGSSGADVDITFRVAVDKVAAHANDWIYAIARRSGNSEYRPRLVLKPDGTIAVSVSVVNNGTETGLGQVTVAGLTQAAGQYIDVHAQVSGSNPTTINIRAWADGQSEPSTWQLTVTDSTASVQLGGAVGLLTYLSSGATNAPVTFSFDDYSVTNINP